MREQVTAVGAKGNNRLDFSVDEPEEGTSPPRAGAKFLYPGGSRPLDGYTIKRGIGQGGFGEIYYALSDAGKEVALKLVRRNLDVELRGMRHCLNLKHPNLLALYDIRQDDQGDTWVVMEYVSGECLSDAVDAQPEGMPLDQVLAWFHGIAAGVAHLHDRGIVHRDLKPGNIFSDEGLVKVGDYGLSKFISCSRRSGQTESVGTVHYMAPEVANGRYGKEIDIYALGIVLYEMLTGRVPFEGESVGEVLMKHLTATADVSMLAEPYRSVVARALEKDPAKRFGSVAEMLAALPQPAEAPPGVGRLPSRSGAAPRAARSAEGVVHAEMVDEEPILKAIRENWASLQSAWNQANFNTPVKVILLLACAFALVTNLWLVPVAVFLVVFLVVVYAVYRVVRTISRSHGSFDSVQRRGDPPPVPRTPPPETPRQGAAARHDPALARTRPGRRRWHPKSEQAMAAMVMKPARERFVELLGSMLVGALVTAAMCVVIVLLYNYHSTMLRPEQCAWLGLMSIAGTWAVLIPAKFWEGTKGEAVLRRFIMMVIGLGLGALAYGTATMLMVELPVSPGFPQPPQFRLPPNFYQAGSPLVMAYLACFGTLFLLLQWWRQADPLRPARLSLWSLAVTMVIAGVVAGVWHFPEPWLLMVAAAISVSVQLSSPWINPRERARRIEA